MRFAVSCRQPLKVRNKAQEITVDYKDINFIDNYIENPEEHWITLFLDSSVPDWDVLGMYNEKLNEKFMVGLQFGHLNDINELKSRNIKFFLNCPIYNYYDLNILKNLGVAQVIVGPPLLFEVDNIEVPLRLYPDSGMSGFWGTLADYRIAPWIRPEALHLYELYTDTCDFFEVHDMTRQAALLDIYQKGVWNDNLQFVIKELKEPVWGQHLPIGFDKNRLNCKQICQRKPGVCRSCYRGIEMAKLLKEKVDEQREATRKTADHRDSITN